MTVIGFDFGTTNSLISIVRGSRPINYLDDESRPIPSVVCYEGNQTIVGRAAKQRLSQSGLGVQGNAVRSPKTLLGRDGVYIEGVERNPVDIVADVVKHVLDEAKKGRRGKDLGEISGAVVTIPVDMQGHRRRALRDAFRKAGLKIVQFVHEPLAALYGYFRAQDLSAMLRRYDRKLILVFDWGGGTLDLTLCRPIGELVVQLKNDGTDQVGGDVFDESIMNRLLQKVCASRQLEETVDIHPGAKARLLDLCERAKIDLSSRERASVYLDTFFRGEKDESFDYTLGRAELEEIVSVHLENGFRRIGKILADAHCSPEQVALCLATGGMANMPAVRRRLNEMFGPERVQIPDGTQTLIAEGAAWIAADDARLQLAKSVELVLSRNSYLPLIKAGTLMPREKEVPTANFHLYCTDPRDGSAKFQICAPERAGKDVMPSEPRSHLENLTVKVDAKAQPFRERLELTVQVDDDLVLTAHARSLNIKDEDKREVHSLEFGLAFPVGHSPLRRGDKEGHDGQPPKAHDRGSLSVRANVADKQDLTLVPGELLGEYARANRYESVYPTPEQSEEGLYYAPCAGCGLASNDPRCQCSKRLRTPASLAQKLYGWGRPD
jgi:molecular chaperone DnaK